jgi:prepilin-type N-terminal cleavage/methylation domain-containing protein
MTDKFTQLIIKDRSGVTLLEMVVAVSLFALTMVMATSIFQSVINSQRAAIASEDLQENIRYDFERIGKDIRTAQRVTTHGCLPSGMTYWNNNGVGDKLRIMSYRGQCLEYSLRSGQIYIAYPTSTDSNLSAGLPLTPKELTVNKLFFKITDNSAKAQAQVTMKVNLSVPIKGSPAEVIDLETTLSSRSYQ